MGGEEGKYRENAENDQGRARGGQADIRDGHRESLEITEIERNDIEWNKATANEDESGKGKEQEQPYRSTFVINKGRPYRL